MNETTITFTIDEETKAKAEMLFSMLGLDMETALQIFLKRSVAEKGLPFSMNMGNEKKTENTAKSSPFGEKGPNIPGPGEIMKSVSDFFDNITK